MPIEDQIPGYADALAREEEARELAFLDVPQDLLGVAVVPLTLRRVRALTAAGSPFFGGGAPTAGDVAVFLWALSPEYQPADAEGRVRFTAELAASGVLADLAGAALAIGDFLDWTWNDAPCAGPSRGSVQSENLTSFEANYVDTIASVYHWSEAQILDCPLPRLFQYLRRIALRTDPKAKFASRYSLKVKGDWLRSLNAQPPASTSGKGLDA